MTVHIRLTEATLSWFSALLPPQRLVALQQDPELHAIGAVRDTCACGVLVFRLTQVVQILHIAVSEGFERQGIATGMLDFLCEHAYTSSIPIVASFPAADQSDPVYLLFAQTGRFTVEPEEGEVYRVDRAMLDARQLPDLPPVPPQSLLPFFSLPRTERHRFWRTMQEQGLFLPDSTTEGRMLPAWCLCSRGAAGEIAAAAFVEALTAPATYCLSFVYCAPGASRRLLQLLDRLCGDFSAQAPEVFSLYIAAANPQSQRLLGRLLPTHETVSRFYQAVWDMDTERESLHEYD